MDAKLHTIEEPEKPMSMNPKLFAMWLFIVTVIMVFAGLTSAYVVRQGEGNWLQFDLPILLWITSGIILASSGTMHWAYLAAKRDNLRQVKMAMTITTLLGIAFVVGQVSAWGDMVAKDVYLVGNPSGSFVYILTGLHGLHLFGGMVFLLIVLGATYKYKVHSKNMNQITMCATYWHFLDGLWLYLFIFLLLNR
jgi:cytochrome c oxidase subunit 3